MNSELAFQFSKECAVAGNDSFSGRPPFSNSVSGERESSANVWDKGKKKDKEKMQKAGCPVYATLNFVGSQMAEKERRNCDVTGGWSQRDGGLTTQVTPSRSQRFTSWGKVKSKRPSAQNLLPSFFLRGSQSHQEQQDDCRSDSKFCISFTAGFPGSEIERVLRVEDVSKELSLKKYLLLSGLQRTPVQEGEGVTVRTWSSSANVVPLLLASARDAAQKGGSNQLFQTGTCHNFVQAANVFFRGEETPGDTISLMEQPWLSFDRALNSLHKKPQHLKRQRTKVALALTVSFLTSFFRVHGMEGYVHFQELKNGGIHVSCSFEVGRRDFLSEMYLSLKKNNFQAELVPGTSLFIPLPSSGELEHTAWIRTFPFTLKKVLS